MPADPSSTTSSVFAASRRGLVVSPQRRADARDIHATARRLVRGWHVAGRPSAWRRPTTGRFAVAALQRAGAVLLLDAAMRGGAPWPQSWGRGRAVRRRRLGRRRGFAWLEVDARRSKPPETALVKLTTGSTGTPRGDRRFGRRGGGRRSAGADRGLAATERASPPSRCRTLWLFEPGAARPARGVTWSCPRRTARSRRSRRRTCGATFFPTVPAWLSALRPPSRAWPAACAGDLGRAPLRRDRGAVSPALRRLVHVFYGSSECGGIATTARARRRSAAPWARQSTASRSRRKIGQPVVRSRAVALAAAAAGQAARRRRFVAGDLAPGRRRAPPVRPAPTIQCWWGKNVDPRGVEDVLRRLGGVEDVAVLGVDGERAGEPTLRAVIACAANALLRSRPATPRQPRRAQSAALVVFVEAARCFSKLDRRTLARFQPPFSSGGRSGEPAAKNGAARAPPLTVERPRASSGVMPRVRSRQAVSSPAAMPPRGVGRSVPDRRLLLAAQRVDILLAAHDSLSTPRRRCRDGAVAVAGRAGRSSTGRTSGSSSRGAETASGPAADGASAR
jgi:hypothetical protein